MRIIVMRRAIERGAATTISFIDFIYCSLWKYTLQLSYTLYIISYSCSFEDAAAGATFVLREMNSKNECEPGASQRSC